MPYRSFVRRLPPILLNMVVRLGGSFPLPHARGPTSGTVQPSTTFGTTSWMPTTGLTSQRHHLFPGLPSDRTILEVPSVGQSSFRVSMTARTRRFFSFHTKVCV